MREELNAGKSFKVALEEGIKRAWPAIRDGNLTTLLVCAILFFIGTSFVRGFAMTLSLGILVSMFTAIVVTGNFLRIFVGTRLEKIKILW
jgi:preprotein translocase subunit SecD